MRTSTVLFVLFLLLSSYSHASPEKVRKSDIGQLRVAYNGMFIDGAKWKDAQGNHVAFLTSTGLYESREEDPGGGMSTELFAYHYTYQDDPNQTKSVWTFHETELNCPLATLLEFIDGSFSVTDLDNDGVSEVWFAYRGGCMGDITPWPMSIVMYEGNKKYTMSGEVRIVLADGEPAGGEYQFDQSFQSASGAFKTFADKLWKKHRFYYDYSKDK